MREARCGELSSRSGLISRGVLCELLRASERVQRNGSAWRHCQACEQRGGTGRRLDLSLAKASLTSDRGFLAGGLTPDNVEEIITTVQPFGVDVASGIEDRPGIKSAKKMAAFVAAVDRACAP